MEAGFLSIAEFTDGLVTIVEVVGGLTIDGPLHSATQWGVLEACDDIRPIDGDQTVSTIPGVDGAILRIGIVLLVREAAVGIVGQAVGLRALTPSPSPRGGGECDGCLAVDLVLGRAHGSIELEAAVRLGILYAGRLVGSGAAIGRVWPLRVVRQVYRPLSSSAQPQPGCRSGPGWRQLTRLRLC